MNLHAHLADTLDRVDPAGPDLTALTATARTQGTRLRRRRRAGTAVVATVAVLGLSGGAVALAPGGGSSLPVAAVDRSPAPAEPTVEPDLDGPRVPTTAAGVIVALRWAVEQRYSGTVDSPAGEVYPSGDQHASLRLVDGLGASTVQINVQREVTTTCADVEAACERVDLPDGSRLLTYETRTEGADGTQVVRVADLRRVDGTRVVASSTNGIDKGETWWVTRTSPPLSRADLEAVVRWEFWGPRLPVAFVDAGRSLSYASADPSGWESERSAR